MIDLLTWTAEAAEHAHRYQLLRRRFLPIPEADTWHALRARMLASGLHELRDEALFRQVKALYLSIVDQYPPE